MRDPGLMGSKIKSRADGKNPEIYRFQINNSDQTSTHCFYTVFVWCHLKELNTTGCTSNSIEHLMKGMYARTSLGKT